MKKIKSLALAVLMMSATAATFTSCGGGEEIKQDSGLGVVKFLIQQIEGDLKFDASKKEDIAKALEMKAEDEYMSGKKEFKEMGYYVSQSASLYEGTLQSISYDSFYDDDKKDGAKKDSEEILAFLNEKLGKTSDSYGETSTWTKDKYTIDFTVYENGWGLYVRSKREVKYPTMDEAEADGVDCEGKIGDFKALTEDLTTLLLANLKSGKITIGKTTEAEIAAIFGDASAYEKEFDGIRVAAYFTYEENVLASIRYDYFYDCEGTKTMLAADKTDVKSTIELVLGTKSITSGSDEFETYEFNLKTYKISQSNFSDGFAFSINK